MALDGDGTITWDSPTPHNVGKPQFPFTEQLSTAVPTCRTVPMAARALLAFSLLQHAHALTDIPSQLRLLPDILVPAVPSNLPDAITARIGSLAWGDIPAPLQRALLWDAGLVLAATSDGDASDPTYLQVYVPCGRTMNDVFMAKTVVARDDDSIKCTVESCNANSVNFVTTNCHLDTVARSSLCGLDQTRLGSLANESGPSWSQDGQIDDTFEPVVVHQYGAGRNMSTPRTSLMTVEMFAIKEKPSLELVAGRCPSKASFIIPCRQLDLSDPDFIGSWCVPEKQLGVELWLKEVSASTMDTTAPSAESSSSADASTSSESDSSSSGSSTAAIVLGVLLALAVVVCVVLLVRLRKKRSQGATNYRSMPLTPTRESEPFQIGSNQFNYIKQNQQADRPSEAATVSSAFANSALREVEAINESYRNKSKVLAEFCEDQGLMMKRIAFVRIEFFEKLDKGANGEVWRGQYEGQIVAVKRALQPENGDDVDIKALEEFAQEIRLASTLDHPNVVRFIGLSWRTLPDLSMVSEFMPMGNLARFLEAPEGKQMTWGDEKVSIAGDVANALVYLHSLVPLVVHRDLKSRNVLLDEQLNAKLSDFGLSRERSPEETMTSGIGTLLWTAPEVLRGERYDEKADMYSFGVLLVELDTCLPPYSLNPEVQGVRSKSMHLMPLITSGDITPAFSADCPLPIQELAMQCLSQDAASRPPAMQVVYHLRSKIRPLL